MPANRQTRRREARAKQQPAAAAPTLEQLAALPQIQPLIINLDACRIHVRDIPNQTDGTKELLFVHVSGGVVFRALIPPALRRELATLLTTPPGIVVPTPDTPAA